MAIAARDPGPSTIVAGSAESEVFEIDEIRLESLSDTAMERIAADRLGDAPTPAQQQLLKSAAGNPFFAVELLGGSVTSSRAHRRSRFFTVGRGPHRRPARFGIWQTVHG